MLRREGPTSSSNNKDRVIPGKRKNPVLHSIPIRASNLIRKDGDIIGDRVVAVVVVGVSWYPLLSLFRITRFRENLDWDEMDRFLGNADTSILSGQKQASPINNSRLLRRKGRRVIVV